MIDYTKLNEIMNKYGSLDKDELKSEIILEVQKAKQSGSFNLSEIENTLESVMPYLDSEKKQEISFLLELMKNA